MAVVPSEQSDIDGQLLVSLPMAELHKIRGAEKTLLTKGTLEVILVHEERGDIVFINLQSYQAPVLSNVPCLSLEERSYVFPMPDCVFYGITLPVYLPNDLVSKFEAILAEYGNFRKKTPKQAPQTQSQGQIVPAQTQPQGLIAGTLTSTGDMVVKSSQFVAFSVVKAASILGSAVSGGGRMLRNHMTPTQEPAHISQTTKSTVKGAREFTGSAVKLSASVVAAVSVLAREVGGLVATGISHTPVVGPMISSEGGPKAKAARGLAHASVSAVSNVYDALLDAGEVLVRTATDTTTQVVQHKYGDEAGDVTRDALGTVCDATLTVRNVASLGPRTFGLQTASEATKALADPSRPLPSDQLAIEHSRTSIREIEAPRSESPIETEPVVLTLQAPHERQVIEDLDPSDPGLMSPADKSHAQ